MQDYVQWLNSDKARGLDPVIMAGIAYYEFVRIHPFVDGNGRMNSGDVAAMFKTSRQAALKESGA